MHAMTATELKKALDEQDACLIIDLQEEHAYEHRHLPGAMNIPFQEGWVAQAATLVKEKGAHVVLYGEFDELGKGNEAAELLEKAGYTNVCRLTGGLMGWMEAGFPVEGGRES